MSTHSLAHPHTHIHSEKSTIFLLLSQKLKSIKLQSEIVVVGWHRTKESAKNWNWYFVAYKFRNWKWKCQTKSWMWSNSVKENKLIWLWASTADDKCRKNVNKKKSMLLIIWKSAKHKCGQESGKAKRENNAIPLKLVINDFVFAVLRFKLYPLIMLHRAQCNEKLFHCFVVALFRLLWILRMKWEKTTTNIKGNNWEQQLLCFECRICRFVT